MARKARYPAGLELGGDFANIIDAHHYWGVASLESPEMNSSSRSRYLCACNRLRTPSGPGRDQGDYFGDCSFHFWGETLTNPTILWFDPDYGDRTAQEARPAREINQVVKLQRMELRKRGKWVLTGRDLVLRYRPRDGTRPHGIDYDQPRSTAKLGEEPEIEGLVCPHNDAFAQAAAPELLRDCYSNSIVSEVGVPQAEHDGFSGRELVRIGSRRILEGALPSVLEDSREGQSNTPSSRVGDYPLVSLPRNH